MPFEIICFIFLGILAGTASGMFGVGGGVIIVPLLSVVFQYLGFDKAYIIKYAIATSLSIMLFTSLSSFYFHLKNKNVIFEIIKKSVFFIILGTLLGAFFSHYLKSKILIIIFALFLFYISITLFFNFKIKKRKKIIFPSKKILAFLATIIGLKSSMLGLGGGVISIPMLLYFGYPMRKAAGTTSFFTFVIALVGSVCYMILGLKVHTDKDFIGYIYVPAFILVSIFSFVFIKVGVKISNNIPNILLKKIFGILLFMIFLKMLIFDLIFS
jgi:hypothetical protein